MFQIPYITYAQSFVRSRGTNCISSAKRRRLCFFYFSGTIMISGWSCCCNHYPYFAPWTYFLISQYDQSGHIFFCDWYSSVPFLHEFAFFRDRHWCGKHGHDHHCGTPFWEVPTPSHQRGRVSHGAGHPALPHPCTATHGRILLARNHGYRWCHHIELDRLCCHLRTRSSSWAQWKRYSSMEVRDLQRCRIHCGMCVSHI